MNFLLAVATLVARSFAGTYTSRPSTAVSLMIAVHLANFPEDVRLANFGRSAIHNPLRSPVAENRSPQKVCKQRTRLITLDLISLVLGRLSYCLLCRSIRLICEVRWNHQLRDCRNRYLICLLCIGIVASSHSCYSTLVAIH